MHFFGGDLDTSACGEIMGGEVPDSKHAKAEASEVSFGTLDGGESLDGDWGAVGDPRA